MTATPIYLEVGRKKVFAVALDWPGWTRAGKTEESAIEALAAYADRYAAVPREAGIAWPKHVADEFRVMDTVPGDATTDFGAPGKVSDLDRGPVTAAERRRLAKLIAASWTVFDRIAAETPPELAKGPRGGGRDRDKMIDHVIGAEASYIRKLGVKYKQPARDDTEALAAMRGELIEVITSGPVIERWPLRYLTRRLIWHVLDHAWEMQDKTPAE